MLFARTNSFGNLPFSFGSSLCRKAFLVGFTAGAEENTYHKSLRDGKVEKG
ncbi:MAG: hypothetical protein H8D22_09115 [Candidatus Cloacimonetes bacterium]|nr:hypothetical protein [Candidatus Cloacimonadota bacterium]